ncbi:HTH-type transcriptional regulator SyrM 1 [compost metagenome]
MKSVIAKTDLVAMLPERLVRDSPEVQIAEPPVEIPGYELAMLWDERSHRDPAHQWLRELIAQSVQHPSGSLPCSNACFFNMPRS